MSEHKKSPKKRVKHKRKTHVKPAIVKKSFSQWLVQTALKVSLIFVITLILYAIYLDGKVQNVFEGQRWQIPVQVFGQVETLHLGDEYPLGQMAENLRLNGYQKVAHAIQAAQFEQSSTRLIFYRRQFDFGFGLEPAIKITVELNDNKISALFLANEQVNRIQLEPILLDRILPESKEDRVLVNLEDVPEKLLDTLLLVEDRDFYFHKGVSPLGILRALFNNLKAGRTIQGGSTLTQQLVKNMFLTRERTLWRKINEALMALILEYRYSKDQLLEAYINEVYLGQNYGNGIYGFGLASQFYFGKNIAQLDNAQMALLIAQIKGPSYYDPWRHSERAIDRRDLVLRLMFEQNYLSRFEFEQALESSLSIRTQRRLAKQKYPAYLQLVKTELSKLLSDYQQQSGIRVFTGFSHLSQQRLEQTISKQLEKLDPKEEKQLQAAMLVTDISSGEIRALVGDRASGYAGFNRALYAKRAIGSLIKPVIYLAALERFEHYNFATLLDDKPITLASEMLNASGELKGQRWQPKNYDGKYRGQVPLIDGLVKSLNIPTVNLGMKLGLENIANAMHLLGYQDDIVMRPSMLLGAVEMSPLDINQLYLPIAAEGIFHRQHTVTRIVSDQGETLWQIENNHEQRLSSNGVYLLNNALEQVTKTGTAKSLTWRLPNKQLAGKTGTTNDLRDSWFIGYDESHLITTWVGRDDNKSTGLTGSSGALLLFTDFIKHQGVVDINNVMPEGVSLIRFEKKTGNAVTDKCKNTIEYPAISAGIMLAKGCLEERERSWLERLFGE
jgi:penicillin-binding protein 1B